MLYTVIKKALFQLDPERAHEFTFQQLRRLSNTPLNFLFANPFPPNLLPAWAFLLKTHSA